MRRIGFLRAAPPPERDLAAFLRGLASRGWVQGRDFVLTQWGDGNVARLPELAVALVNAGVDIILAEGVVTTRTARCPRRPTSRSWSFSFYLLRNCRSDWRLEHARPTHRL